MGVEEAKTLEEAPGIAHGSVRMLGMLGLALTALGCPVFRGLVGGEKKKRFDWCLPTKIGGQ